MKTPQVKALHGMTPLGLPDDYADVLAILAECDGACLYWQMPDVARGEAAARAGIVLEHDDLLVHPKAKQIEYGMAYTMPKK